MFTTLLESRAQRARRARSTFVSVLLHSALIAIAVAATTATPSDAREEPAEQVIIFDVRRQPLQPRVQRPIVDAAPRAMPDLPTIEAPTVVPKNLPPIDLSGPPIVDDDVIFGTRRIGDPVEGPSAVAPAGSIVDEKLVDRAPRIVGEPRPPQYPSSLRQSGVTGQVVVQFVVDTLGRAEMGDVQIVETSHAQFADAVRSALASYRFSAGEAAGHKVRTRVQLPFTFSLR